jgi:hypothetical protein
MFEHWYPKYFARKADASPAGAPAVDVTEDASG